MRNNNISALKIAATYIGMVIGAGFATGQEILQFFAVFGINGLWGLILIAAGFVVFGFITIETSHLLGAKSYLDILKASGKIPAFVLDLLVTFFLFGSVTAMVAGAGALFSEQFGLPGISGNLIMAAAAAATVLAGTRGLINSMSIVTPFVFVSLAYICIHSIVSTPPDFTIHVAATGSGLINHWFLAAILYISYNMVLSIAVLAPLGPLAKDKKTIAFGSVLGGLGLGAGAILVYLALYGNFSAIQALEVPMSYIAGNISPTVQILFSAILTAGIYTTAVGALYGFASRVTDIEKASRKSTGIIVITGIASFFASLFGFSTLVQYLYPIMGYGGLFLLAGLLYGKFKLKSDFK